jgi:hypothetical protein
MKAFGIGLAAALIVATAASSAFAAKSDIPPEARKAGMAAAPALVQAGNLPCTVTDARLMGVGTDGKVKTTYYEVACKDAVGYVLVAKDKVAAPESVDCIIAGAPGPDGKPSSSACKLPDNLNPGAGLNSAVAATGHACSVDKARYIGSTSDKNLYEVACHEGPGYVLQLGKAPATPPIALMCSIFGPTSQIKCELTPPAQQNAAVDQLAISSGKACSAVKDRRYVGSTSDRTDFFEVACTDGKGYMLQVNPRGQVEQSIDCVKAASLAGGCTLTDTRQAQTEQIAVYTDLAKKAGFDCNVSKYADFPTRADGAEIVELACSNRPDGGVGVFPAKGAPTVWNCLIAGAEGYTCSFTDVSPLYSKLSDHLKAKGKGSCVVSGARSYARTSAGADLIEVACADGGPGWVVEYAPGATLPTDLLNCVQAAKLGGGGCQLPTNKLH